MVLIKNQKTIIVIILEFHKMLCCFFNNDEFINDIESKSPIINTTICCLIFNLRNFYKAEEEVIYLLNLIILY